MHLGGHGEGRSQDGLGESSRRAEHFGKAEVCNFGDAFGKQYIFCLEVSVDDVNFVESLEAVDDLLQVVNSFVFWEPILFGQHLLKISIIAVLHYNENTVAALEVIDQSHHVGVVFYALHDVYLGLHQLLDLLVL